MSATESFTDLLRRVRTGDAAAAATLVRQYEPAVRRAVRVRLLNDRLRRCLDSMDVCQSVMGSFFVRAALGQYDLHSPESLLKLLTGMVRNKLTDQVRRQQRQRRDARREEAGRADQSDLAGSDPTPSQEVAARELLAEFRKRLSDEERRLAEMRADGREWAEVAAELGGSPEALRKRLQRAVHRVAGELGLEGFGDDQP